jgi:glycosyltransferase involved in cell wall biosynthesis
MALWNVRGTFGRKADSLVAAAMFASDAAATGAVSVPVDTSHAAALLDHPAQLPAKRVDVAKRLSLGIVGTRGIPARHGGFETFAEHLALYLVERGWDVTVYCQTPGRGPISEDQWHGVKRVLIPISVSGALGTILFDWQAARHASKQQNLVLTLGYNTAIMSLFYRATGTRQLINMDGLEWQRNKWRFHEKAWLFVNERLGCWLGHHLIADHPEIENHLATRVRNDKITMIPYGAAEILAADPARLEPLGLTPGSYALVIARPEPENSILEIVRAFSRVQRNYQLVVLGNYDPVVNRFHRSVIEAASEEVIFPGAIYDAATVQALRFHARLYIHGHTVGGTNPSLVEAMAAGSPVLAYDNRFNRWVAVDAAHYFSDEDSCAIALDSLLRDDAWLQKLGTAARARFLENFRWSGILEEYEHLLASWAPEAARQSPEQPETNIRALVKKHPR